MSVQVLDASKYLYGTKHEAAEFCETLITNLSEVGFVKLVNHNIPADVVDRAFESGKDFFKLPADTKSVIAHPPRANPNRGWSAIGQEKSSAITDFEKGKEVKQNVFDAKEAFDMGAPSDPLYDNMWLSEPTLPGFRSFMSTFYALCQDTHMWILRAIETGFAARGVQVEISNRCRDNVSELRLNWYPSIEIDKMQHGGVSRISKHTDFGTVTLLFQDTVGGLEIEDQKNMGTYFPVEAGAKTEMLVNVGDSLQRLTNDVLTSVSHQVTLPVSEKAREEGRLAERYSIAYFAKVSRDQSLKPMVQFVDVEHPAKYQDMTAYELNQMKLKKIYG